jgi:hypothetical protein
MSTTYNLPITPPTLASGFCFESWQQIANELVGKATVQFLTDGAPTQVIKSSSAPASTDTDKLWFNLNDSRVYFYGTANGLLIAAWVSEHPTPPGSSERRLWVGSTGDLQTYDGGDTNTAGDAAGPMWEVDSAFAARFPVGVGTFAASGSVAVTGTGGEDKHTLTANESGLPAHTHSFGSGVSVLTTPGSVHDIDSGSQGSSIAATAENTSASAAEAHNNLPPYYGVYFIKRTSRIYYKQ